MTDPIAVLLGSWSQEINSFSILFRIFLAFVLSAIVGCERSSKRHSAGLRTFIAITLATTVSMLMDVFFIQSCGVKIPVLSASCVLSIAVISIRSLLFSSRSQIKGLTTAAGLWACGIIGLAVGAGFYLIAIIAFFALIICLNWFPMAETYLKNRSNHFEIHLELKDSTYLQNFVSTIRRLGLTIDEIEKNTAYTGSGLSVYSIAISISSQELKKYKTHAEIIEALKSLDYIYHIEEMHS